MASANAEEAARVENAVRSKLPPKFDYIPDGWPGSVELALIDAVLSIRAVYGKSSTTGVRRRIGQYKADAPERQPWDDLRVLATTDPARLSEVLDNRQMTGGVTKAEAIVEVAKRLTAVGAIHAADIDAGSKEQHDAYCGTTGLGPITWTYFLMLLGNEGVKADTLVTRFVASAVGRKAGPDEVSALVAEVARRIGVTEIISRSRNMAIYERSEGRLNQR